jgi:hypothetical protein
LQVARYGNSDFRLVRNESGVGHDVVLDERYGRDAWIPRAVRATARRSTPAGLSSSKRTRAARRELMIPTEQQPALLTLRP